MSWIVRVVALRVACGCCGIRNFGMLMKELACVVGLTGCVSSLANLGAVVTVLSLAFDPFM